MGGRIAKRAGCLQAAAPTTGTMSEDFDPYYRWLGIRDKERPPNHYRLLGLELFEDNPEVISEAADRQMGHVRTHQTGQYAETSQELLNVLAKAKVCLLNPNRKRAYDNELRKRVSALTPASWTPPGGSEPDTEEASSELTPGGTLRMRPSTGSPTPLTIKLTVLEGPQKGQSFEFSGRDTFTVGRSRQATFVVKGDKAFSRVHFSVRVNPPVCFLKNLNDKQGTKVNGKQVTQTLLKNGDTISAGLNTRIGVEILQSSKDGDLGGSAAESVASDSAGSQTA